MRQIMFMTLAASDKLSCWEIDDSTGELEFLSDTEIDGRPAPLALDTEKSIIYVGRRDIPRVSSYSCLLYTSPSPRDKRQSRMPSSA